MSRTQILKRLEALEALVGQAASWEHQRSLQDLTDDELAAIEAWYEAGKPGAFEDWLETWETSTQPERTTGGIPRRVRRPSLESEAPTPAQETPRP